MLHVAELPACRAKSPKLGNERAVGAAQDLDAAVARVGDGDQVACRVKGGRRGGRKLPVANAERAHGKRELGGLIWLAAPDIIEYLDAMVARVGDDEPLTLPVQVDRMRGRKLPIAGAAGSKLEYGRAVGLQDLHAVVARVGNGEQVIARDRHALRPR